MADLVINQGLGRMAEWFNRVDSNDPAGSVLRIFIFDANAETDANIKDADTIAALQALLSNEVTNTGYANIALDDTDLAFTVDDGNDRVDLDFADQTWNSVGAGDAWEDMCVAWDPDGLDTDANTVPGTWHDFLITPDGSDITVNIDAAGFYRAS